MGKLLIFAALVCSVFIFSSEGQCTLDTEGLKKATRAYFNCLRKGWPSTLGSACPSGPTGSMRKRRKRKCQSSEDGLRSCDSKICDPLAVIDGVYTEWGNWTDCSANCGPGEMSRDRTCTEPAPRNGGADCVGSAEETTDCNLQPCTTPVNGRWGTWSKWELCPVQCGGGQKSRSRACNNPAPAHGGNECVGDYKQIMTCNSQPCKVAVDGGFGDWTGWTGCTHACGGGVQGRSRACNNPTPSNGGRDCEGLDTEVRDCNSNVCVVAVDGGFGDWTGWSQCSVSCGGGEQGRSRKCDNPAPANGGSDCSGDATQTQACNSESCLGQCVRERTDFSGKTMRDFKSEGLEDCAAKCMDSEGCKAIMVRYSDNHCWLKSSEGGDAAQPGDAYQSVNMKCSNEPIHKECIRLQTNFPGKDLKSFHSTGLEACAAFCRDSERCKSITLRTSDNYCWLKSKEGGDGAEPESTTTSMNINCVNKDIDQTCLRERTDFSGATIKDFGTTGLEACVQFCQDSADCKSVMLRPSSNNCWLKNKEGGNGARPNDDLQSMNLDCSNKVADLSCVKEHTDYSHADIANFAAPTIERCADFCRDTEGCEAITFRNRDNRCYLKNEAGGGNGPSPDDSLTSLNMQCRSEEIDMSCLRENTMASGSDMRNFISNGLDDCIQYCQQSDECKSVTVRYSDNRCYLYGETGGDGYRPDSGYQSINMKCSNEPIREECIRLQTNFPGKDLKSFHSTGLEACAGFCRDTEKCKSITLRTSDNYCWLKSKEGGDGARPSSTMTSMNINCVNKVVDKNCLRIKTDFSGATITDFGSTDLAACVQFCLDSADCKAIMHRPSSNQCWLKNKEGGSSGPLANDDLQSMNMECDYSAIDNSCLAEDTNFRGDQLRQATVADMATCVIYCRDTAECNAVTFEPSNGHCSYKRKQGGDGAAPTAGYYSINVPCESKNVGISEGCMRENTNFSGADITDFRSTGEEQCQEMCHLTETCVAITLRYSDNNCWLKNRRGGSSGAFPDNSAKSMNMDC